MSLPSPLPSSYPPTTSTPIRKLSPQEQIEWDAPYTALAQKSNGDLRLLLHSFFSFLHRKTDFYVSHNPKDVEQKIPVRMGFKEGDAEKLLIASFRQFPLRRLPPMKDIHSRKQQMKQETVSNSNTITNTVKKENSSSSSVNSKSTSGDDAKLKSNEATKVPPRKAYHKQDSLTSISSMGSIGETRFTKEGKQIPVGNGGTGFNFNFQWTQTIEEISIGLPLPPNTRARDLDVNIKRDSILIKLKKDEQKKEDDRNRMCDSTPIMLQGKLIDGKLKHVIRPDESTWTLEDNVLLILLDKKEKTWWDAVLEPTCENDAKNLIDTSLLDVTSKISEYDDATQKMIRKVIFDQRQERLGLPKSDDILRKARIEKLKNGDIDYDPPTPDMDDLMINDRNIADMNLPAGVEYIDNTNFPSKSGKR